MGIWYQIDAGDVELATFFFYLGEAARPFLRKGRRPLPALTPEYLQDIDGFSRRFFRDLFALLPSGACIVLDNYQEVPAEEPFHHIIAEAVAEVTTTQCLIVISRRDPPNCYARLVANENVAFVDWSDLRLTLEETRAIIHRRSTSLSAEEVERVHTESGGWAAGVTLLLEGRRRRLAASPDLLAERDLLFDYFAAQIFAQVPEETRRFLVMTALLPQVPVTIARELTANPGAADILEHLYERHFFTHRRGSPQPIYWYHALFRDYLLAQGERLLGAEQRREHQRRAARLLETTGSFDEAFLLFRAGEDWEALARMVDREAENLLAQGRGHTLRDWIKVLPKSMLDLDPWLRYWLGTSLIAIDPTAARSDLEAAYELFVRAGSREGQALSAAGVLDSHHFEWADFTPMAVWVERLGQLIERGLFLSAPERELKVYSSMLMGIFYGAPRHPMLARCEQRVFEMLDERLDDDSKVKAATFLLAYCNLSGEIQCGRAVVERVASLPDPPACTPLNLLWWYLRLGHYHTMLGDVDAAAAALATSREIGETHGLSSLHSAALLLRSYETNLACIEGDLEAARRLTAEIEALASPLRPMDVMHLSHNPVYLATISGDPQGMVRGGRAGYQAARSAGICYTMLICLFYEAHGLALLGKDEALHQTLETAHQLMAGTCMQYFECEAAYVLAFAALSRGSSEAARPIVEAAVHGAQARGYHYPYMSRLSPVLPVVLNAALEADIERDYVHKVIRRYRLQPPSRDVLNWPWPVRIHTLSRFQVLVAGVPLHFIGKTPRKPLALLKAIIADGCTAVPQSRLIDALWPNEDGDAGKQALGVTLVRLRKLLGAHEAVLVADERVTLNPAVCWVDAHAFQSHLRAPERPGRDGSGEDEIRRIERALALYKGAFLPGDGDQPWSVQMRLRLRGLFTAAVEDLGARHEARCEWERAISLYRRGLDADDLIEEFYLGQMRCYLAMHRQAEGMAVFRRLRQTLGVVLGVPPSPASETVARALSEPRRPFPGSIPTIFSDR